MSGMLSESNNESNNLTSGNGSNTSNQGKRGRRVSKPGPIPKAERQSVQRPFRLHQVLEDLFPQLRLGTTGASHSSGHSVHRPELDKELLRRLVFQALMLAEGAKTNPDYQGPDLYNWEPPDEIGLRGQQRGLFFYPADATRIDKFIRGRQDTNSSVINRLCWIGALYILDRMDALSYSSDFWYERRQRWAEMEEELDI